MKILTKKSFVWGEDSVVIKSVLSNQSILLKLRKRARLAKTPADLMDFAMFAEKQFLANFIMLNKNSFIWNESNNVIKVAMLNQSKIAGIRKKAREVDTLYDAKKFVEYVKKQLE